MTDTHGSPTPGHDDAELLRHDLACVSAALSEITTVWRRAVPHWPELQLNLPVRLQDSARQLAAAIQADADTGPARLLNLTPSLLDQLSALRQNVAAAQAMTCGHGMGDDQLWQSLHAALVRAVGHARLIDGQDNCQAVLRAAGDGPGAVIR